MRLALKLFLGVFLIAGLAAFFVMRVFVQEVKPGVRQSIESSLIDTANVLSALAADDLKRGMIRTGIFAQNVETAVQRNPQATVWRIPKQAINYEITITDSKGIVVYNSNNKDIGRDNSQWNDVYRTLRGQYGARSSPETPNDETHSVMHVAAPIYDPADGKTLIGVLSLAHPNRFIDPFIEASQKNILRQGALLVVLSALIGVLMTGWLSYRISQLIRYARAVGNGSDVPPPASHRDELGELGQSLESMRRKLQGKEYVEHYVQSLTHEMKSPLAAIRGAAELLQEPIPEQDRKQFIASIQTQEQRLTTTIDKLLALASVEQHGWLQNTATIDLSALCKELLDDYAPLLAQKKVQIQADFPITLAYVKGDVFLLEQAIRNLLDNAIAFSPANGTITLALTQHGHTLRLSIQDQGSGIPEYAQTRLFERFYSLPRPDSEQRSSGLGLPFVKEVARLHQATVTLHNRRDGQSGALATLEIPLQSN